MIQLFVLRWWFRYCWSIVKSTSHCLWEFCVCICFVMHYFLSILVLQSSWRGRVSWMLCNYCLTDVLLLQMFCGPSYGAVGWSAVCDCGVYWSYSLTCRSLWFHYNNLNWKKHPSIMTQINSLHHEEEAQNSDSHDSSNKVKELILALTSLANQI